MNSKISYPEYSIQEYLKHKPFFFAFLRPLEVELFRRYLPLKKPVLDFGCGDGFFAKVAFLNKQGKVEIGIDVDSKIKRKAEESGAYENVVIYNGQELLFPNDSFNSIVSNCVLEHIPNLETTVKEFNRVLKTGGKAYLTLATDNWENNLLGSRLFGNIYKKLFCKIQNHHHLLSPQDWRNTFLCQGFSVEQSIEYLNQKQTRYIELFHYLFWLKSAKIFIPRLLNSGDENNNSLLFLVLTKK